MKNQLLTLLFSAAPFFAHTQNVGIGTTSPLARLHVKDSSVLFSATGTVPVLQGLPPAQGAGRRMMWYAGKAAFRAGFAEGANWDKDNIGNYSFASGYNTEAKGIYSTAMGGATHAVGLNATALGNNTFALGEYSTALGTLTASAGYASTAMGFSTSASGFGATSLGVNTYAKAPGSLSIGRYNNYSDNPSPSQHNSTDRVFQIGNGFDDAVFNRSNAFTILRNGNTGIGIPDPVFPLQFSNELGDKVSLFGATANHFGFGVQDKLLQIHSSAVTEDIAFGYGSSAALTETMRIKGNGKVGIGISSPTAPLSFANTTGTKISLYNGIANAHYGFGVEAYQLQLFADNVLARISFGYYAGGAFTERMFLDNNTGTLNVAGVNYASDERYKKQITLLQNPIEKIEAINGVEYYMRTDEFPSKHFNDDLQVGLLAQEVEKILPQAVQTNEDGYKAIDYARVVPLLVEGIKEQQKQIAGFVTKSIEQQKQIDALANHEKGYQQQLDDLKNLVKKLTHNN